ncbi:MAG TPA: CDP-archaeol synthase [Kiritimatiellae bacterium]|nr:CDP-archaeol synthase [Kiritimatiellia bacterium]
MNGAIAKESGSGERSGSRLLPRVQSTLLLAAGLLAAAFWLPPAGVLSVLILVCGAGTLEFYSLLDRARIRHFKVVGTVGGLLLVATSWFSLQNADAAISYEYEWFVLFGLTVVILLRIFPQKHNPRPLETLAATLLGVMYVPFLFNFFTKLLMVWGGWEGRLLVLYLIAVVKATDVGAYAVGCSFGKHRLLPRISPLKTWEGTTGGIFCGLLASILFHQVVGGDLGVVSFNLCDAAVLGLLLPLVGVVGDLTESQLKRAAGVKDSGRLIMGVGGVLDLIDSLLFAAPTLYIYSRLFMVRLTP